MFRHLGVCFVCALVLFLTGCKLNDGVLRRSAANYFPLDSGSEWRYDVGGTSSLVQVWGDSLVDNSPVTVVLRDYEEEYWLESQGDVSRFVDTVVNLGGTDYPLEQRFRRFYVLPFVLGNSWSDDFDTTAVIMGDTFRYRHDIDGKVAAIDTVTVPAGSFTDCYEVDLNELVAVNDSETNTSTREWYAPDVGLVKRIRGSSEELLTEDSIP